MASIEGKGITNAQSGSCVEIQCTCSGMWSIAQDFCHRRMASLLQAKPAGVDVAGVRVTAKFLLNYHVRARRIAATYARLYLETEQHGQPDKKGRYYWMALGAFASKTVACVFEHPAVKYATPDLGKAMNTLAKGNLWLFYDVTPWHWAYSVDPQSFDMCKGQRNANDPGMEATVRKVMRAMPAAQEALPKIGQFKKNKHIDRAFTAVKTIEALSANDENRAKEQLANLMAIAKHEQGVVLQPLIYDDAVFAMMVQAQRLPMVNRLAPPLELVFAAACETEDPELKSVAPEGTQIEVYESRMDWIRRAADKFHGLMQGRSSYMEAELKTIASWVAQT